MLTEKIKQLQALQAKAAELQIAINEERTRNLAGLPAQYGYDSLATFIKALKAAAGSAKGRGRKAKAVKAGKRGRTKITPELKVAVKAAVEAGKTGAAIAAEFGISLPSVQNIKKEFGMVKARAGSAEPAAVAVPAPEASAS